MALFSQSLEGRSRKLTTEISLNVVEFAQFFPVKTKLPRTSRVINSVVKSNKTKPTKNKQNSFYLNT